MKARVSSRPKKFRRAGMEFTMEPQTVEVDRETLKALQDEPMLAVEILKETKEPGADPGNRGK